VDLLEVNDELLVTIADDEDTNGTRAASESLVDLLVEVTLGNDGDASLDLADVGLDVERSILTGLDDLVLLEGWGQHGVEDHGWRWVADNADFLNQAVGEKVNTEVSVLASGSGGCDADDLAWALLEDDQVTDTDVVARDGEVGADNWSCWLGWSRTERADWGSLGLGDGDGLLWESVTGIGLGVVALCNLGLSGLDGMEEVVNLGTEVLGVTVVAGTFELRHLGGFGFSGSLLGLLVFLDVDNWRRALALFLWLTARASFLTTLVEVYVDLFDVSGLGNVNLWLSNETNELLVIRSGLSLVRGFGLDFSLDFGFRDLDTNVSRGTVKVVGVVVDGVELLVLRMSTNWQSSTSSKSCSGTSSESGSAVGGVVAVVVGLVGMLGCYFRSSFFSSSGRGFVRARGRRTGGGGGRGRGRAGVVTELLLEGGSTETS
jgi:hypothetical protein